jgi:hypothetical protein
MAARNDAIREAALSLMRKGLATPFEIAWLSGMSRQLTRHWARSCIDSREAYLRRIWAKTLADAKPVQRFPKGEKQKAPLRKIVEEI